MPSGGQWPPITIYPIPIIPGSGNNRLGYCTIRFLNAAVGYDAVNIYIGSKPLVNWLPYGDVSSYYTETAGFKNIRITDADAGRGVLSRERFFFNDGDVYTIALVNSGEGIAMVLIPDIPCYNQMQNFACVRAVNLSYNAPALDVVIRTGRIVFDDLRFKSVSAYKQIFQGETTFSVQETESGAQVFDMTEWVEGERMYTLYIIGDAYTYPGLNGLFTEDYSMLFS